VARLVVVPRPRELRAESPASTPCGLVIVLNTSRVVVLNTFPKRAATLPGTPTPFLTAEPSLHSSS
jgi:hypothetical protein